LDLLSKMPHRIYSDWLWRDLPTSVAVGYPIILRLSEPYQKNLSTKLVMKYIYYLTASQARSSTLQQPLFSIYWLWSLNTMRWMKIGSFIGASLIGTSLARNTAAVIDFESFCACIVFKSLSNTSNGPEAELLRQSLSMVPADRALCDK